MAMASKTRFCFISLALLAGLVWSAVHQLPDNRLHLVFCDVGQGDAILAIHGSSQILIDGGPGNQVLTCLEEHLPFWDRRIEMVMLTHPEADHLTGLIEVAKRYEVGQFVVNALANDTAVFREWRQAVLAEGTSVYSPQVGDGLRLGPIELKVLWAQSDPELANLFVNHPGGVSAALPSDEILGAATIKDDFNETSIVTLLSFGSFDAFLSGDIGFDTEGQLVLEGLPTVEVIKVAHHGSKYSSSEAFLQAVSPEVAVISVGKNSFGHPTEEVLQKLRNLEIKILRTDQDGSIEIVSDGKSWYTAGQ
ncbi:hypothetical protein COU97_02895 [Candidatus Shapirobacteria bacterium CG10_big_fil_rev_8_21_14_0_10_48_15]|uniref:Metallo-beta-lactamase domain-containing protein n=1 Tax=Candidatus Shapirobacteria bacterium CG10_big_fil_rev_8_21_14_0_10_48_15 TaxID=1974484 RepID=A0A2M8L6J0_9BACT|nr:MAG: hypothetical protein COU97_02895 [Candidatus Shapirobacteria bacterium CG10_big_fil_rev_8_21_14_0_10_48_15]